MKSTLIAAVVTLAGEGDVIALDRNGNYAMTFNSEGLYRGRIGADGVPHVLIDK